VPGDRLAPVAGDLCSLTATEAVGLLRRGEVSSRELVQAALERIERVDPALNALPTVCGERALEHAGRVSPETPLAGLPLAVKDLNDVAGVRSTQGSPIFADHVPGRSDLMVARLEERGGVVLAKSNTPEFGAGGNTFNEVFGETRNPWDTTRTCGGSSGGSAAALASGQVWLATGSDLGGSLRTPAGFCGVVGMRPSPGRVAHGPSRMPFGTLSVEGPMARTVADVALMLDTMCGRHPLDPLSLEAPQRAFSEAVASPRLPASVAYSVDLGISPVAADVCEVCDRAATSLAAAGVEVVPAHPDLSDAPEAFQVLRAVGFVADLGPLLETHRDQLKPDVIWNIEQGLRLTTERIGWAERARGAIYQGMSEFLDRYRLLLCPTACVAPFDVALRWVRDVDGVPFDNYVEWLRITSAITLTSCPVVALPCGFTGEGLPIGLQLVGRPRGEWELLQAAAALEQVFGVAGRLPVEPDGDRG
jgi:amidase